MLHKTHHTIHSIAYVLGGMSIAGFLIGFLRDRAFAHFLGASEILDIYIAAFRIPDLLFLFSTGIISFYALILVFEEKKDLETKNLSDFINTAFYFLIVFLVIGGTGLFFAIPYITDVFFNSFSTESANTFILLSRIFLVQAILFSVATFFTAILQFKRKFFAYSLLAIIYNVGIIFGTIFLYPIYGAVGLALGVLVGIISGFCFILLPVLIKSELLPSLCPTKEMIPEIRRMMILSFPRASIAILFNIANIIIFSLIISVSEGLLSVYYFSETLYFVPYTIFALSYSVASFPILARYFSNGEMGNFISTFESAIKQLFLFIIPSAVLIFIFREQLVSVLFETGTFTNTETKAVSTILGLFVFNLLSISITSLLFRIFFASHNMYKALLLFFVFISLKVGVIYLLVKTSLLDIFVPYLTDITGLTEISYITLFSIVLAIVVFETLLALTLLVLTKKLISFSVWNVFTSFVQHITAGVVMGVSMYSISSRLLGDGQENIFELALYVAVISALGLSLWYIILRVYKNKEIISLEKTIIERI